MAPRLRAGDWLLVDPGAFLSDAPRPGELVLAEDEDRLLVKRVGGISPEGTVALVGDAPSLGTHRHDTTVPLAAISGRPWFRFWPPGRIGRVR